MTTFHELFGTTIHDSPEQIRKRYKLLSHRVHPDKGGSVVLMQLIQHAYISIKAGKGLQSLSFPSELAVNHRQAQILAQIKHENLLLKAKLRAIKTQSANKEKEGIEQAHFKGYRLAHINKQLEKQITALKQERHQLMLSKEKEKAQKIKLAKELKRIILANALNEKRRNTSVVKDTRAQSWIGYIVLILVMFCLALIMFKALFHSNNEPNDQAGVARFTNAVTSESSQLKVRDILLISQQEWEINFYQNSTEPYISVQNEHGSYVTLNCSGIFVVYFSEFPAYYQNNLSYLGSRQGFYLFQLLKGEGAQISSWLKNSIVKIHHQYFINTDFDLLFNELSRFCVKNKQIGRY